MKKALQQMKEGRKQEALGTLKKVVMHNPGNPEPALLLAQWLAAEGELSRAQTILFEQVARHPRNGRAHHFLAELLREGKRNQDAERHYREALSLLPQDSSIAHNHALMLQLDGRVEEAVGAYEEALRRKPDFVGSLHNLAAIRLAQGDLTGAAEGFSRVVEVEPGHLNAIYNLGVIAERSGDLDVAESRYVAVLRRDANNAPALYALASLLFKRNRNPDWAEKCYKAFIRLQPQSARAYNELGLLLATQGRADEAIPCFEAAIDFSAADDSLPPRENFVNVLLAAGRLKPAIGHLVEIVRMRPDNGDALLELVRLKLAACEWSGIAELSERIERLDTGHLPERVSPLFALAVPGLGAETRFRIAERHAAHVLALTKRAGIDGKKPRRRRVRAAGKPLRVGYLFTDLDGFTPSDGLHQIAAHHDRDALEIFAYSFNKLDAHAGARRVAEVSKVFRELWQLPRTEAADLIRADKLDVLVDFNGWTSPLHTQALATRPAACVVSAGAYPATLGDKLLCDHVLSDAVLVPDDSPERFAEQILRLPHCARLARPVSSGLPDVSRETAGLPVDAFVYCSFAPPQNINPDVFDVWCGVVSATPNSLLWLANPGDGARQALVAEAQARGVPATRIVFADAPASEANPAYLKLADVALDTWPMSAETLVLDALRAGVPLVSMAGDCFAGKIGATCASATGGEELVADSTDEYLGIAVALATDPGRMRVQRAKLAAAAESSVLFDPKRFTETLESLYQQLAGRELDRPD